MSDSDAEQDEEIIITLHEVKLSHAQDKSSLINCTKQSTLGECSRIVFDPYRTTVTINDDDSKYN